MYITHSNAEKAFEIMSKAYSRKKTSISAIAYFLSLIEFEKKYDRQVDTVNDRDVFSGVLSRFLRVGIEQQFTADFKTLYTAKTLSGYCNSNFFSASSPAEARKYQRESVYPSQHSLFICDHDKLKIDESLFSNYSYYAPSDEVKFAICLWVLRGEELTLSTLGTSYSIVESSLKKIYSESVVNVMMPSQENFDKIAKDFEPLGTVEQESLDFTNLLGSKTVRKKNLSEGDGSSIVLDEDTSNLLYAMRTKPFLILAGISGTGKSRKVRELAYKSCPPELHDNEGDTPENYCMIEVKPNWHDSTELLGYYSSIEGKFKPSDFDKFIVKAWYNQDCPFFVCLDEMNLAPVEQYFAEYLSVLETRRFLDEENKDMIITDPLLKDSDLYNVSAKCLNDVEKGFNDYITSRGLSVDEFGEADENRFKDYLVCESFGIDYKENGAKLLEIIKKYKGIPLPPNLIVVGTVNMDDTTYQFSRKVLDRSMTIEMKGLKLEDMFTDNSAFEYPEPPMSKEMFLSSSVKADDIVNGEDYFNYHDKIIGKDTESFLKKGHGLVGYLYGINKILNYTPFQVSYRVLNEMVIYLGVVLNDKGLSDDGKELDDYIQVAVDNIMLMKILPRIEGDIDLFTNKGEGKNKLEELRDFCQVNELSKSYTKLVYMCDRLDRSDFTRFWP